MNTIINAIPEYIITAVISTAIFYALKGIKSLLHNKALHAKTAQAQELWGFLDSVANTAVNSLVSADMSGNDKFVKATNIVQSVLEKQGFTNVDVKSIETAVQSAYENSSLTPTVDPYKKDSDTPAGTAPAIDPKEVK